MYTPDDQSTRPDDEETSYFPTATWCLYLMMYERHTMTERRPLLQAMMQRYLQITCFGCGGDLDVPLLLFGPTRLCPDCLTDQPWLRN